jgi:hypothetical protein
VRSRHALRSCASRIQVAASVLMPADPDLSALLSVRPKVMLGAPTGLLCRTQLQVVSSLRGVRCHGMRETWPAQRRRRVLRGSSREIAVQREGSVCLV